MPQSTCTVLIGGHEDRSAESVIHRRIAQVAGGAQARVVICTAATVDPAGYGETFVALYRSLGVRDVRRLDVPDRATANARETQEVLRTATAVVFTGGDQARLMATLDDTRAAATLRERAAAGMVVAGTSAGCAALGDTMIAGTAAPQCTRGLGVLPGALTDQHFSQRQRERRLLDALESRPLLTGLGVDEDTAAVVRDGRIAVIGSGSVTVVLPADRGLRLVRRLTRGMHAQLPGRTQRGVD